MHEHAPAKVNLFLHIENRRDDGLHDLVSLIVFTAFGDRVHLSPSTEFRLERTGPFAEQLPENPRNDLCLQAATQMVDMFGRTQKVTISLEKNIPVAAGIGGGSSDAAAVLRGLCRLWELDPNDRRVISIAAGLGADVPVCLQGRAGCVTGIGDVITPLDDDPGLHILLVNPNQAVSTAAVFGALHMGGDLTGETENSVWQPDQTAFVPSLRATRNDLTGPALGLCPAIADVLQSLEQAEGCELARMSGSGATCFAVFPDAEFCSRAASRIAEAHPDWWVCATRTQAPETSSI